MNAEIVPRRARKIDVIKFRGPLDVGEGQSAIGIGNTDDLIEPRDSIANVPRIGKRLFTLRRKGINAVRQVALRRQHAMFLVRLPGRLHRISLSFLAVELVIPDRSSAQAFFKNCHQNLREVAF
ncbi:MAG TPA: hypothetical protein VIJ04_22540 [Xanthobacteraceae bacterium]